MPPDSETSKFISPDKEGEYIKPGDEIIVPGAADSEQSRTIFSVSDSKEHDELLMLEEQTTDERFPKARAYFRKGKHVTYELIPDHIKGEEGRRFLKIAGALATAAAAGAGAAAYIVIRHKSKE